MLMRTTMMRIAAGDCRVALSAGVGHGLSGRKRERDERMLTATTTDKQGTRERRRGRREGRRRDRRAGRGKCQGRTSRTEERVRLPPAQSHGELPVPADGEQAVASASSGCCARPFGCLRYVDAADAPGCSAGRGAWPGCRLLRVQCSEPQHHQHGMAVLSLCTQQTH